MVLHALLLTPPAIFLALLVVASIVDLFRNP